MPPIFTLAHLSDVHLPPLPVPSLADCNLKRLLGFLNWHRRRKFQHSLATLALVQADLSAQAPDHVAVTGDLVNIGLPAEYRAAGRWLESLGPPQRLSVVPGNHDIYVELGADPGVGRWRRYMSGSDEAAPELSFPYLRRLGRIALVGLNSAVPTRPFHANGRLGSRQLREFDGLLAGLGAEQAVRVVLIHHPPLPGQASPRKALDDAGELAAILGARGAELILHGHNHRAMATLAEGPERRCPVIGVPSASMAHQHGRETLARYNLYRIAADPEQPIEMIERGIEVAGGPVVEIGRRWLVEGLPHLP